MDLPDGCRLDLVQIEKGRRVRIRVHLAVVGGDTLEKSVVEYIQGGGKMLPGLEAALQGLEKGAKKEGVLKAKEAFGNPALSPHKKMKRSEFPKDAQLKAGERFAAKDLQGSDVVLAIEKVDGDTIDVQLMHALGDKDISYDVEVLNVTDPAPPPVPVEALKIEEA
jgi:FKBP-type peptidyl-prolyl cis-trans isomerase 2